MICSHCHKDFPKEILIINSHTEKRKYYNCRKCNRERHQKYSQTPEGKKHVRAAVYKSIEKYRDRQNARARVYYAVKRGEIIKPKFCSKCGEITKIYAHHITYSKKLNIQWLCMNCHRKKHKKI
jgi:hypothetical protein